MAALEILYSCHGIDFVYVCCLATGRRMRSAWLENRNSYFVFKMSKSIPIFSPVLYYSLSEDSLSEDYPAVELEHSLKAMDSLWASVCFLSHLMSTTFLLLTKPFQRHQPPPHFEWKLAHLLSHYHHGEGKGDTSLKPHLLQTN